MAELAQLIWLQFQTIPKSDGRATGSDTQNFGTDWNQFQTPARAGHG